MRSRLGRLRRLEVRLKPHPRPSCEACGDRVIIEEHLGDGTVSYIPEGAMPCPTCGNRTANGRVGKIVVDLAPVGVSPGTHNSA